MQKNRKLVLGIGTDVGKTVVSAILAQALGFDYWKPVQTGDFRCRDSKQVAEWVTKAVIHPESYRFSHPVSPHYAAQLEGIAIEKERIFPPLSHQGMIIEGCGGVLVPLSNDLLLIDIMKAWTGVVILVVRHYLGSINHALLSIEALQSRGLFIESLVFNGEPYPEAEEVILKKAAISRYLRLLPECIIDASAIRKYASLWSVT